MPGAISAVIVILALGQTIFRPSSVFGSLNRRNLRQDRASDGHSLIGYNQSQEHLSGQCTAEIEAALGDAVTISIVGGNVVSPPFKYTYVANLVRFGTSEFCGAVLIAPNVVATAAHCDKSSTSVWIGRHDLTDGSEEFDKIAVLERAYPPTRYDPETDNNDIMLLRLERNSTFKPIAIDAGDSQGRKLVEFVEKNNGLHVTTMGWVRFAMTLVLLTVPRMSGALAET